MARCVAALLTCLLLGCGGSNPGGGTRTLFVSAFATTDGSTDGTGIGIEVREGSSQGPLVSDAVVIVRGDRGGEMSLPWQGIRWGNFAAGAYFRTGIPWESGWAIDIRRGPDRLDAYLVTPGVTVITEPIAATTFRRADGRPLAIRWKDDLGRRAKRVRVQLDKAKIDQTFNEDALAFDVEPNRLVPDGSERITVERTNEIELAGGIPGSVFRAQSRHRIEIKVE